MAAPQGMHRYLTSCTFYKKRTRQARETDLELGEHTGAPRHNTRHLDERIEVLLSNVAEVVRDGKLADAHVDLRTNALILCPHSEQSS